MSRPLRCAVLLTVAGFIAAGCGARTGDDELLGPLGPSSGGQLSASGGRPGVGGGAGGMGASGGIGLIGGSGGQPVCGAPLCDCNDCRAACECSGRFEDPAECIALCGNGEPMACCAASLKPGCANPEVEECVCAQDPFCCANAWDPGCVQAVEVLGCGLCDGGGGGGMGGSGGSTGGSGGSATGGAAGGTGGTGGSVGGSGGGSGGECCDPHLGQGCGDPEIEACVCQSDPFCCDVRWDALCAREVLSLGCGSCGGTGGSGGATGGTGGSTGGSGGSVGGTGGAVGGSGGAFGAEQCAMVFNDACGQCLCGTCLEPLSACLADFGCLALMACFEQTGCLGSGCYQPQTCQGVIDFFGGPFSSSMGRVTGFLTCTAFSGCPCQ